MADDRLDDAIDAVVRAVDRIERATRASVPVPEQPAGTQAPSPPQPGTPFAGSTGTGTTSAFWAPREAAAAGSGLGAIPGQAPAGASASPGPGVTGAFDPGSGLGSGIGQRPQSTAEYSALGAAAMRPYAEQGASPETHELVGRIVGRMQALDDHLAAASRLRGEISELVARLAAAAGGAR